MLFAPLILERGWGEVKGLGIEAASFFFAPFGVGAAKKKIQRIARLMADKTLTKYSHDLAISKPHKLQNKITDISWNLTVWCY